MLMRKECPHDAMNRCLRYTILVLCLAVLVVGCRKREEIDSRLYGRWKSADPVERFDREAYVYYTILKHGSKGKVIKSTSYPKGDQPLTAALMGEQTYRIKPTGPGMLEWENIDKNIISRIVCTFIDCETVATYEFLDDNTVIIRSGDGEEMQFVRQK